MTSRAPVPFPLLAPDSVANPFTMMVTVNGGGDDNNISVVIAPDTFNNVPSGGFWRNENTDT